MLLGEGVYVFFARLRVTMQKAGRLRVAWRELRSAGR